MRSRPLFSRRLDPALERLMRRFGDLDLPDPLRRRYAAHRRAARDRMADELRDEIAELSPRVAARDAEAVSRYDALLAGALTRLHNQRPPGPRLFATLERALYRDGVEHMDDPTFPLERRVRALDALDRFNALVGSYDAFLWTMLPLVEEAERRGLSPVRVHDVATGHGGFALYLSERLGDRVRVTGSDLCREYLELGRERARRDGLDVSFCVADALEIDRSEGGERPHLVTCTQSLHHFPPGALARLVGAVSRAAEVGVMLVDGERSWVLFALATALAAAYARDLAFVHDAAVSLRRMYYEEELALLVSLAPGLPEGATARTGLIPPAHAWISVVTRAG